MAALESFVAATSGLRGGARIRRLLRDASPVSLIRKRDKHGVVLALDPDNVMDQEVIRRGSYEPEVLNTILAWLPNTGVFWDVGANVGIHSLAVQRLRPGATVFAFEPSPPSASRLMLNLELNSARVQIMPCALGASAGYSVLSYKLRGNSGIASLSPWPGAKYDGTIRVRVETGDELISAGVLPAPSVAKIDVEGLEYEVLSGMRSCLATPQLQAIIFESAAHLLERTKLLIQPYGFCARAILPDEEGGPGNYIATR